MKKPVSESVADASAHFGLVGRGFAIAIAFAVFTLAACVHTSRRPAEQPRDLAQDCERALNTFLTRVSIDGGNPRQSQLLNAGIHIGRHELPNRARRILANKNPSCEANQTQDDLVVELDSKIEILDVVATSLAEYSVMVTGLNGLSILRDPHFARNTSCIARCSSQRDDCDRVCGVERDYVDQMVSADGILSLVGYCVNFEGPKNSDLAIFEQLFNNYRPRIVAAIERGAREANPLHTRIEAARQELIKILPHAQVKVFQNSKPGCKPERYAFEPKIRGATTFLTQATIRPDVRSEGSGFYIKSQNETRLVTAQHVYNADDKPLELNQRWIETIRFSRDPEKIRYGVASFKPEPNMFDKGNDIVQARVGGEWPTAELVAAGEVPKRESRFFIAGFPGGIESNFKIYECKFLGYDRSFLGGSEQAAYVFSCPAIPGGIQGMSGGPVFDDQAKVWGVISEHSEILGRVYASPLSRKKDGSTVMGIQHIFLTDYCFRDNLLGFKKCQMMPGAFSMGP